MEENLNNENNLNNQKNSDNEINVSDINNENDINDGNENENRNENNGISNEQNLNENNKNQENINNQPEQNINNQPEENINNQPEENINNQPEENINNQPEENNNEINTNNNAQTNQINQNNIQNREVIINNQSNNSNININNQSPPSQQVVISYEVNDALIAMVGSNSEANKNKEKIQTNQYSFVDVDDPELFDGKIKCVRLKCIAFAIMTFFINTIRLFYLIFLHLGYPAIIWGVRFACAVCCFCCILFQEKVVIIDPESGRERIDYPSSNFEKACALCKNCGKAFYHFLVNFVKCPCWFYAFVLDCLHDIKNRALDNARNGCYKFIHNDCGCYEKVIEDPFNNYMKKRHIILTTDPYDDEVIYGNACKDNTII